MYTFHLVMYSQLFCDFGEKFVISDVNGEQPGSNMMASVSKVCCSYRGLTKNLLREVTMLLNAVEIQKHA